MNPKLSGLIAAPHTPFHADGSLNLAQIPAQARLLAQNGVRGAFICGTTGEGSSLTADERKRVVEAWVAARPAGLAVIVHVGHLSQAEAREFARHAQQSGADAVAALAPSFFKPASVGDLVTWSAHVAAGAPQLPYYYYHMPAMTGVNHAAADFLREAEGRIPNLAGIKFTHENLMDFAASTQVAGGKYTMLFGRDEILLAGLALGAPGAVGSTYNFAAPLYHRIIAAFQRGDLEAARRDQLKSIEFIEVLGRHGGLSAGKTAMKLIGIDCGPVRSPLRPLTARDEQGLREGFEKIGFFEYASKLG